KRAGVFSDPFSYLQCGGPGARRDRYFIRYFSIFPPSCNFAVSQRGLRPRPVQVSLGSSGLAYLAATVLPLPPRPPKISLTLKPAPVIKASAFLRTSALLRS